MPYSQGEPLFSNILSHQLFEGQRQRIRNEVERLSEDHLFGNSIEDVLYNFVARYELDPLVLYTDRTERIEEGELEQQVFDQMWGRDVVVKSNYYIFAIPFTGPSDLFQVCPSTHFSPVPRGWVNASELHLPYLLRPNETGENVNREMKQSIDMLKRWTENLERDVRGFNSGLPQFVRESLAARRQKLERDRAIRSQIEFPIRQRSDVSSFTPIPLVKKRPVKPLQTSGKPFSPEPALLDVHYNQILESLQNMAEQIERSPNTFAGFSENDIRNVLLVSFNDSYKGNATGETFSKGGKSDIYITENGKCIFIAECKIWKGPASLTGAIDQLLDYTTWRNTKTAILLFNRNKRISEVLEKIIPTVEQHQYYKRTTAKGPGESIFRFTIKDKNDPGRELQLAILVFDIPSDKAPVDDPAE